MSASIVLGNDHHALRTSSLTWPVSWVENSCGYSFQATDHMTQIYDGSAWTSQSYACCAGMTSVNNNLISYPTTPGPLFTKRAGVVPQDLVTSRSHEILVGTFPIALKFDSRLGSIAAEMLVKLSNFRTIRFDLKRNDFHFRGSLQNVIHLVETPIVLSAIRQRRR